MGTSRTYYFLPSILVVFRDFLMRVFMCVLRFAFCNYSHDGSDDSVGLGARYVDL